jgi:hypothetical protein
MVGRLLCFVLRRGARTRARAKRELLAQRAMSGLGAGCAVYMDGTRPLLLLQSLSLSALSPHPRAAAHNCARMRASAAPLFLTRPTRSFDPPPCCPTHRHGDVTHAHAHATSTSTHTPRDPPLIDVAFRPRTPRADNALPFSLSHTPATRARQARACCRAAPLPRRRHRAPRRVCVCWRFLTRSAHRVRRLFL